LLKKKTGNQEKIGFTEYHPLDTTQQSQVNTPLSRKSSSLQHPISNITSTGDRELNIPESAIEFQKEIGGGAFGKVYVGIWQQTAVAIKVSNTVADFENFSKEAGLMVHLRPHPNVLQVLGVCVDGKWPSIIMEFCSGGSLDKFLFNKTNEIDEKLMFQFIVGISRGMLHLHKNHIIHRDLAARNVLLSAGQILKIADFGMSRVVESGINEGTTKTNMGPIRWMSPESLKTRTYSTKSDSWSFGIVVYEIIAREEPHKNEDILNVGAKIRDEILTPKIPENCDEVLRKLMESCWKSDPQERPEFDEICEIMNKRIEEKNFK